LLQLQKNLFICSEEEEEEEEVAFTIPNGLSFGHFCEADQNSVRCQFSTLSTSLTVFISQSVTWL
jgi:hypothetical protein